MFYNNYVTTFAFSFDKGYKTVVNFLFSNPWFARRAFIKSAPAVGLALSVSTCHYEQQIRLNF